MYLVVSKPLYAHDEIENKWPALAPCRHFYIFKSLLTYDTNAMPSRPWPYRRHALFLVTVKMPYYCFYGTAIPLLLPLAGEYWLLPIIDAIS